MLQFRPFFAAPAGTLPSTPGCFLDPGPHGASGVAWSGGSARRLIATGAGVSPLPWPTANRSFSGDGAVPPAECPANAHSSAVAAATERRAALLIERRIGQDLRARDRTRAAASSSHSLVRIPLRSRTCFSVDRASNEEVGMRIAVVGKGNVGGGLADLWEKAGHDVTRIGREGGDVSDAEAVLFAVPGDSIAAAVDNVSGLDGK